MTILSLLGQRWTVQRDDLFDQHVPFDLVT